MRVNNIASNTAFARAIKLCTYDDNRIPRDIETKNSIKELQKVLNSKHSRIYSEESSEEIRDFFRGILGDYNGENGVRIYTFDNDTILLSGDEARIIDELYEKADAIKEQIARSHGMKASKKKKIIAQATGKPVKTAFDMLENGRLGKQKSILKLQFSDNILKKSQTAPQYKIEEILYKSKQPVQFVSSKTGKTHYSSSNFSDEDIALLEIN